MRWLLAILVIFTMQLKAEAQESADMSSHAPAEKWGRSRDVFVQQPEKEQARAKAFLRYFEQNERSQTPADAQDSSAGAEGID